MTPWAFRQLPVYVFKVIEVTCAPQILNTRNWCRPCVGANAAGATADAVLDTVDFELDINGAIRTSTSIISDTARILNLDIDNFVTPNAAFRAPNLKTYANNTGTPWAPNVIIRKDSYRSHSARCFR